MNELESRVNKVKSDLNATKAKKLKRNEKELGRKK